MKKMVVWRSLFAIALLAALAPVPASAGDGDAQALINQRWAGSWSTSNTETGCWPQGFVNPPRCAATSSLAFDNQTVRMTVRTTLGGTSVRVRFSNAFGKQAIDIGRATVALADAPASPRLRAGTLRELAFGGVSSVTVHRGTDVVSDPVALDIPLHSQLAVSFYLPTATGPAPVHLTARQALYIYPGDATALADGATGGTVQRSSFLLSGVDVSGGPTARSVVVLGDSVSDGNGSSMGAYRRWTDLLSTRMAGTLSRADDWGVLNLSVAGGRLTRDGLEAPLGFEVVGLSGLARLPRDVFAQTGAQAVVLQLGASDILFGGDSAARITAGLRQFAAQAQNRGLRVVVCTLPPAEGFPAPAWSADKEAVRQEVNAFIRTPGQFPAVFDMDAVLRDPARPLALRPEYDSGDHFNPNDTGGQALADAFPLSRL